MRIGVASLGRFHMFDLSRQLMLLGEQVSLFTGYPSVKVDADLRPFARTRSRWVLLERLIGRLRGFVPGAVSLHAQQDLARWIARQIQGEEFDLIDALDGVGLEAGLTLQRRGGMWVCNRGSAHISTQQALLQEEYERHGMRLPRHFFPLALVDRCIEEYQRADAVVVPSRFAARSFYANGVNSSKVHICPYGVDLSLFSPKRRDSRKFIVLFSGTQSVRKGLSYLFEAVRPLVRARSVETWIVGPVDPDCRTLLEKNEGLFEHKGVAPRSKLANLYSQASVLVLPSLEEGLALVQAQAMACGTPVIATTNSGAEDLFSDSVEGFIVPIRDSIAIRAKLEWMLANPDGHREMCLAALRRVRSLGGWDAYGHTCRNLYYSLARANGAADKCGRFLPMES
jgi:alpha-maltose-1-phosphate synthase